MIHASTQKLIVKLCEFTEAGHIAWKRSEAGACRFETEGYAVEVAGQPPSLRLLDAEGRELERADEIDLASQAWPDGAGTFASQISLLAARADRIARGAEHAISRILSSLSAPPKAAPFDFLSGAAKPAPESIEPSPPPAPHTVPGPPPEPIASDTAIERVLAVEPSPPRTIEPPAPEPEPEAIIVESEAAAIVGAPETVEQIVAEVAGGSAESPAPEPTAVEPEPVVIETEAVAIVPEPIAPPRAQPPAPAPEHVARPIAARRQDVFGATASFAKPRDPSATPAAPRASSPKPFSTSPLFFGVNQMSREPARTEPDPPSAPPPAARPVPQAPPAAERKPEPAIAGPDIYKPWS